MEASPTTAVPLPHHTTRPRRRLLSRLLQPKSPASLGGHTAMAGALAVVTRVATGATVVAGNTAGKLSLLAV